MKMKIKSIGKTIERILSDTTVGLIMVIGGIEVTKTARGWGRDIASDVQEYVGPVGSGIMEYGFPALVALGAIVLTYKVVKSFDKYASFNLA